ncbi:flagella basal body P-ring formation protein FlgA [Rhodospirillum rubrum]|uniref:flagellar basal body P-ring formation chaperone FlgA n=1 Tax=Rhodospirillum rubrum TaxID=1085 RepID=UPI001908A58F|nr:flagellar basal body P-ring formation chaperone FlgA [Rhodospirillum rubrum]MBK1666232.1 flagella basal body P-ring formation protein FlgA [Rhodospirillum rubrum]MBK1677319.1 flagella basal body P-ring formation protein FlgA [Rhodospirillum rubrum]
MTQIALFRFPTKPSLAKPSLALPLAALLLGSALGLGAGSWGAARAAEVSEGNGAAYAPLTIDAPVSLNRAIDLEGPYLTLGDLFTGVSDKASVPVARAPRPGRSAILDADWLDRTARAYEIPWRPHSGLEQAVITRPGSTVPADRIQETLRVMLTALGAPSDTEIQVTSTQTPLTVPLGVSPSIRTLEEQFDPSSGRFSAVLEAPAGEADAERVRISGRLFATREIPVLSRRVGRDEIIGPRDVSFLRERLDRLPPDAITDVADLVGMTPRIAVRDGQPLRRADVVRPILLKKGALVTMELRMPGIAVSAQGRALDNGAEGDTVRVINTASNQTILATVSGGNRVIVQAPGGLPRQTASR